jgi:uncharacterized protein YndB with AHSA1/START domain
MSDTTITKTVFFAASRQTVWSFLTDKDKLGTWFHRAEADLAAGEEYALLRDDDDGNPQKICWGEVSIMEPHDRLEYSVTVGPLGGLMTQVAWRLEDVAGGTRLTLHHSGIAANEETLGLVMALDAGWDAHLGDLRKLAAA